MALAETIDVRIIIEKGELQVDEIGTSIGASIKRILEKCEALEKINGENISEISLITLTGVGKVEEIQLAYLIGGRVKNKIFSIAEFYAL